MLCQRQKQTKLWNSLGISWSILIPAHAKLASSRHHLQACLFLEISFVVGASNQAKEGQFSYSEMYLKECTVLTKLKVVLGPDFSIQ